jgi:hypothetical protein
LKILPRTDAAAAPLRNSRWTPMSSILWCTTSIVCDSSNILLAKTHSGGTRHEARQCRSRRAGGRNAFNRNNSGAGTAGLSSILLCSESCSIRRTSLCADRLVAGESDPRDHDAEWKRISNHLSGLHALAGTAASTGPGVPTAVRSLQSSRLAPHFKARYACGFLRNGSDCSEWFANLYEIHIFLTALLPRIQMSL